MNNTETTYKSTKIYNKNNQMNTYQWIKGEKAGTVIKSDGSTILENNQEFLIFQDGSRCNTALIGDYIIQLGSDNESDYVLLNEVAPTPIARVSQPQKVEEKPIINTNHKPISPVFDLLSNAKKEKKKLNVTVSVDFPPTELLKVIATSYDNGNELINDYIINQLSESQNSSIMSQIASEIMKDVFIKPTKIIKKKNEGI